MPAPVLIGIGIGVTISLVTAIIFVLWFIKENTGKWR